MVAVPVVTPVTTPVVPTEAVPEALLDQVPPPASVRADVIPVHILVLPVMADGPDTMLITELAKQPVLSE
jgi:hypothetical protein